MNGTLNWKRYVRAYFLTMIGLAVLSLVLDLLFQSTVPTGISIVLPTIMAAMFEGQKRAEAGLAAYSGAEAWSAAAYATMIVGVITVLTLALLLVFLESSRMAFGSFSMVTWVIVFSVLMFVTLLTNRIFLTMGYKNQRKALDKKVGK